MKLLYFETVLSARQPKIYKILNLENPPAVTESQASNAATRHQLMFVDPVLTGMGG